MSHASFLLLLPWALFVKKWSQWTTMMNCEFGDPIILLYLAVKLAHSLDALGQPRMSGSRFYRSEAACQASRRHLMNRKEAILSSTSDFVRGTHGEGGSVSRSSRASAPPRRAVTRRRSAAPPLRRAWPRVAPRPPHAPTSAKGCPRRRHAAARRQDGKMVVGRPTSAASRPLDARGLVHRLLSLCGNSRLLLRPLPGYNGGKKRRGHLTKGAYTQGAGARGW